MPGIYKYSVLNFSASNFIFIFKNTIVSTCDGLNLYLRFWIIVHANHKKINLKNRTGKLPRKNNKTCLTWGHVSRGAKLSFLSVYLYWHTILCRVCGINENDHRDVQVMFTFFFLSKAKIFSYNRPGNPKYLTFSWFLNEFDILLVWHV